VRLGCARAPPEGEAEEVLPDGRARLHLGHGPKREGWHVRVQDPLRRGRFLALPHPLGGPARPSPPFPLPLPPPPPLPSFATVILLDCISTRSLPT
jgi:hypothetical protein